MARDGNGTYSLPEAAFVYDTVIDETAVNSNFSDIASALTASIAKDGQTVPSANLPMGTYKHTGVGNASARDQYAAMGQVQDGAGIWCGTAGGTANAITLTPTPAIIAYAAGQRFEFKAGAASNTGAVTFAISGLSTIAGQVRGAACVAGDIAANQWYRITLSDANTAQIEPLGEWINGTAIGSGKVPQWNGSAWVGATPGTGTVTSIVAGTGLTGGTITSSGTIAVDVGTTASKIVQLDGSAKLPAVDGSQLTGIQTSDLVARDQIALTNLRLMLATSVSTGALVQGKQWELSSDEWGISSTGEVYTSASPSYYTGLATGTFGTGESAFAGSFASNYTRIDMSFSVPNSQTITKIGMYVSAAQSVTVKIMLRNSAGNFTCVYSEAFSHGGGGWQDFTLTTPYSVPASGSYYLAARSASTVATTNSSISGAYYNGDIAQGATQSGVTEAANSQYGLRGTYSTSSNMTLIPPSSVSVSSAPSYVDAYFLWKDDSGSAVLGTDLTVELSRNGGTTYTAATLSTMASYDGTYSVIKARASVSAQASGTSLMVRIKTLNSKAQRVAAPALYAE